MAALFCATIAYAPASTAAISSARIVEEWLRLFILESPRFLIDKCVSVAGRASVISGPRGAIRSVRDTEDAICAEPECADGETAGSARATHPRAAAGRPGLADDREGVRGHDRPGHHRPGERRPGHVLCP